MGTMSEQSISLSSYLKLLRGNANFRRLWMAQIISEVGDWFYMVALYSMLLEFTGRAELLGIAFVLQVTPQALTSPIAGVINDRLRRQRVMIFSDLARAVIVSCMLLVRSPQMIWLVYPLLVLETVMWGLFEPARNAVVPNIVGSEEIIVANTLSSTTWSLNFFLGSALGGAVAAFLGRDTVFVLNGLSFVGSAFLISRMRFNEPHTESLAPLRWRDLINYSPMIEGVRYVRQQARLATAVFVKAGLGVTGASWIIFPILGKYIFPVTGHGIDPERGRAGYEPADGRPRPGCAHGSAGIGSLGAAKAATAARRNHGWIPALRQRIYCAEIHSACAPCLHGGHHLSYGRCDGVGVFHHLAAVDDGR